MKDLIRNNKLTTFVALTFACSWTCWLLIFNDLKPSLFEFDKKTLMLFLLGAYAPSIVALLLTFYLEGKAGVKNLLKRLVMWRVGFFWTLLALVIGPIIYALAVVLYAGSGGFLGAVNVGLLPWIPVVFLFSVLLGPLAEELGWRGFVLPCLDAKNKFISSSVIIGLIWGAWHIPLFWAVIGTSVSGFPVSIQSVGLFFLAAIGTSFFYVWMFNKTMGSVFIAVLIHLSWNGSGNITSMLFPDMNAEQKLALFNYPVAIVWVILLISAGIYGFKRAARPVAAIK